MTTILIIGLLIGFGMALAIGANDVANSMATAVGAKAITPKQAVLIAGVLEFVGATFFGKQVTETIRKGILHLDLLADPKVVIWGSMAALIGATIWLMIATYFSWPVSTTHSIVGGMVGYGIAAGGLAVVNWGKIVTITLSWIISPLVGLLVSFFMFKAISATILHSKDIKRNSKIWIPFFLGLAAFIIGLSFIVKTLHMSITLKTIIWAALFGAFISVIIMIYIIAKMKNVTDDPYQYVEEIFRKSQVVTSCYVALAHGANDVANAIGPVAAIYAAVVTGTVGAKAEIPRYILAMGGLGIAIGVAIWGQRVMKTVGTEITELNNSRGFTIDFSTATTVLIASNMGMPISTTHTVVGSVIGNGLARGVGSINLGVIKDIFVSWFLTVPAAAVVSFLMYKLFAMFM
ncbi:phosphate permease [Marinitoga sp. 1135]|uniref:Phosphate transporter n=2 Tax=Petrotogaceae TaxID=1643949 RepID=H2J624_MARPK|nr:MULTISPECIES: inorganic phosphate transporter [Marinitoga]AEX85085.1 phosphate/sulfate permease [Marinitoga piezophila KA3]APT75591.1 phosphate permease [Marinitoga sp. 1137]NUU95299.1 phosphate permease [Marinitoga sp. 1135]NUU97233.1 phosphate permease [Marinitoga sp. 1138]